MIRPGEEIWVGVEQSIAPEWHTYWRNPGDSGSDPRVVWSLPEGFSVSEIEWPIPHKLPFGPMTNYGYEENVILLQRLKAPDTLPAGPISITADVEILVCRDICIPEYGTYNMTLNPEGGEQMGEDNAAYLAAARGELPTLAPEEAVLRKLDESTIEVKIPSAAWCNHGDTPCTGLELFPLEWGIVDNNAGAETTLEGDTLILRQQAGDRNWAELEELQSPRLLVTYPDIDGTRRGMEFITYVESPGLFNTSASSANGAETQLPFVMILLFALAGGLILNLMPCVFPVLSLKALSLVKTAQKDPTQARIHGLAYTGGIVLSFLAIAGLLIALQGAGSAVGWGFHLQSPVVIILLIYLLFLIGLNLMNFFEFSAGLAGIGGHLAEGGGYTASFFTGVLATLVATPCTAPFMGAAIGFALTQNTFIALLVFAFLGLGLALPYLVLAFIPALQRFLPKPGTWMETFRQFLAFPIFLTCAWLLWVLSQQVGSMGILGAALGLTFITFSIWLWRHSPEHGGWRKIVRIIAILSALAALGFLPATRGMPVSGVNTEISDIKEFGEVYSPAALDEALAGTQPVFVEMTAAWCITCKVNHATSLNVQSTRNLFAEKDVKFLVGDWTNYDPAITEYLNIFGRKGVPLYVYYAPPASETGQRPEPVLLPQILTPGIVAGAFEN
ncbi:MAG: thioredoxin family protein [Alphaproteobacteria bacterium]|nr:thioredoxin family protein [Alphaproteobacteria bacterium]